MTLPVLETPVKFHLSLTVTNLKRSVAFYRVLFGLAPAKFHDDYAKFELEDPPVIFSLVPRAPGPGGTLGRVGFRVADASSVQAYRERLESAGIYSAMPESSTSGHSDPDRLGVRDPDGTPWEISHGEEDDAPVDGLNVPATNEAVPSSSSESREHFVTHPAPERIPHPDGSLDEVRLTGTFNSALDESQRELLVREARRVLRRGAECSFTD